MLSPRPLRSCSRTLLIVPHWPSLTSEQGRYKEGCVHARLTVGDGFRRARAKVYVYVCTYVHNTKIHI